MDWCLNRSLSLFHCVACALQSSYTFHGQNVGRGREILRNFAYPNRHSTRLDSMQGRGLSLNKSSFQGGFQAAAVVIPTNSHSCPCQVGGSSEEEKELSVLVLVLLFSFQTAVGAGYCAQCPYDHIRWTLVNTCKPPHVNKLIFKAVY